ncbi:MAG: ATP-binding protein [Elusimicrobiota bacterium]
MINLTPTSIKQLYWQNFSKPLPSYLNLWAIENNTVIGVNLQMSLVYEYTGVDLLLKSGEETSYFFQQLRNVLHSLPENVTLQFVIQQRQGDNSMLNSYTASVDTKSAFSQYVVSGKVKHFKELNPYSRRYLLYLTAYPETTDLAKMSLTMQNFFYNDYTKTARSLNSKHSAILAELGNILSSSLNSAGIKLKQLDKHEILNLLYNHLNPSRSGILEYNPCGDTDDHTIRSQICYNACENEFSQCQLDGYYYRGVNMYIRPKDVEYTDILQFMSKLNGEYDFCVAVDTVNQDNTIKNLLFNRTLAAAISTFNPFKRNYEAELKSMQSEQLVEYIKSSGQKLFNLSFSITLRDRDIINLTTRTNACIAEFRTIGEAEGVIDDMCHLFLFLSALPNHRHYNSTKHVFHTDAVAQFLPVSQQWRGCDNPKMLFLTREYELLPFDVFDPGLPAKHGLVLGTTGSGKSFTTNFLLNNFYVESENNHIVITDIGGSYRKLCTLLGGEYLEIELSDKYSFNPFPPKNVAVTNYDFEQFEIDADVIAYLKLLIQKLLKKDTLTGQESFVLERSIVNTYKCCVDNIPILSDLLFQLDNYTPVRVSADDGAAAIAKHFVSNLEEWSSGVKGKMLNRRATLEPKSRMVVFDLQKLQEQKELQSVVLFLIQNTIWQKLYDKSLRKMIVFDECWQLFNDPTSAQLIENLYRTARKFNASILSVSQSPDDFLSSKSASAVLANSYTKYILKLQKGHELLIKFGLNTQEVNLVKSLSSVRGKYSEIMVKSMDKTRVLNILVPNSDYWICTTDPEDYQKEQEVRSHNPGLPALEILKILAEQNYKAGII